MVILVSHYIFLNSTLTLTLLSLSLILTLTLTLTFVFEAQTQHGHNTVLEPLEGNVFLEPPSSGNDTTKVGHYITLEKIALPADIKQPGFFFDGNGFGAVVDTSEEEPARDDCVLLEDLFQRQLFKNETDDHLYIKEKTSKTVWCLQNKMRQYRYGTATWSIAGGQSSSWPYWTLFWPRGVAVSEHVCIM